MALNEPAEWLIAYDIRSPRRLRRVHRLLSDEGVWIQYSIFVTQATPQRLGIIRARIAGLIDDRADDVRIYRIPRVPIVHTLGAQGLPDGALMLSGVVPSRSVPFTRQRPRATFTSARGKASG